jgi:hypothetical protein
MRKFLFVYCWCFIFFIRDMQGSDRECDKECNFLEKDMREDSESKYIDLYDFNGQYTEDGWRFVKKLMDSDFLKQVYTAYFPRSLTIKSNSSKFGKN